MFIIFISFSNISIYTHAELYFRFWPGYTYCRTMIVLQVLQWSVLLIIFFFFSKNDSTLKVVSVN